MNKVKRLGAFVLTLVLVLYGIVITMMLVTGNMWAKLPMPILYLTTLSIGLMGFMLGMRATYWVKVQPLLLRIRELEEKDHYETPEQPQ